MISGSPKKAKRATQPPVQVLSFDTPCSPVVYTTQSFHAIFESLVLVGTLSHPINSTPQVCTAVGMMWDSVDWRLLFICGFSKCAPVRKDESGARESFYTLEKIL